MATEASGNLIVRRMRVSKSCSPKACSRRSSTSRECRVRESTMVARMPSISRVALRRSLTRSTVSTRSATPRRAKNSVSSGMMTPWEAVRALMVSSPSEGWQSTRITSYSSSTGRSTRLRACSRATSLTS